MKMNFCVSVNEMFETVITKWYDGTIKTYSTYELTKNWFNMSNDGFYRYYGFNYIPSPIMQRWYRKKYYGE